ncbi:protein FAM229A [Calypte anna]|uniref:protein FAM229A n=1 Tax=Calypte anna TaxID=9244 RepID=UPI0004BEF931|nr:protein FAM229A [Calypte anna]
MSSQWSQQVRRFPMEAGDCPSSAQPPQLRDPADTEQPTGSAIPCHAVPYRAIPCRATGLMLLSPHRQLRRCPGSHRLTVLNVPIDVFVAMGGGRRPRTS